MRNNDTFNTIRPVVLSAFGPPALACIRSWGRAGMTPGMICVQNPGEPGPASKYLSGSTCLTREELFAEHGLQTVARFLDEFGASGLFCIDESITRWLNDRKGQLPACASVWLPPSDMLQRALDKTLQIEVARKVGLEVLPTHYFPGADVPEQIPISHFPLCLRPAAPGTVTPTFKVQNVTNLSELLDFLKTLEIRQAVIGQPFRNLPNLVVHGTRTTSGATLGMAGFLVERKFQGVTLTIRPVPLAEDFMAQCAAFTDQLDLIGHYHFEFLHDAETGANQFLEINHRFGGTTAKVLVCGYQEPLYALQGQGIACPVRDTVNTATASSIKALVKSALFALRSQLTALDYPEESKARRLWSTVRCLAACRDEVFDWDDLQGTAAFYFGKFARR